MHDDERGSRTQQERFEGLRPGGYYGNDPELGGDLRAPAPHYGGSMGGGEASALGGASWGFGSTRFGGDGRGPHAGKGPKGWRRSDERILEEVCERLRAHDEVDASEMEVAVTDGEVTLEGAAPDRRAKRLAEDCCDGVAGVVDVANRLRVRR